MANCPGNERRRKLLRADISSPGQFYCQNLIPLAGASHNSSHGVFVSDEFTKLKLNDFLHLNICQGAIKLSARQGDSIVQERVLLSNTFIDDLIHRHHFRFGAVVIIIMMQCKNH